MELEGVSIAFMIGTNPSKLEESKILLCKTIVTAFLQLGVTFDYTCDTDKPKFTFNSTRQDGLPRITIFYEFVESGFNPRCFWFVDGSLENFDLSLDQLLFPKECSEDITRKWKSDCGI
ncbi:MAG: hypothetical protein ACD_67C00041G0001 [uncultured bacterium]|nr:MAG: hypothetical protein ACD_67C00041G0001 [uncultured bacterium]